MIIHYLDGIKDWDIFDEFNSEEEFDSNIALYAKWEVKIIFNANNGGIIKGSVVQLERLGSADGCFPSLFGIKNEYF